MARKLYTYGAYYLLLKEELCLPPIGPPCGLSANLVAYSLAGADSTKSALNNVEELVESGKLVRINVVPGCGFDGPEVHAVMRVRKSSDRGDGKYLVVDSYLGRKNFEIREMGAAK